MHRAIRPICDLTQPTVYMRCRLHRHFRLSVSDDVVTTPSGVRVPAIARVHTLLNRLAELDETLGPDGAYGYEHVEAATLELFEMSTMPSLAPPPMMPPTPGPLPRTGCSGGPEDRGDGVPQHRAQQRVPLAGPQAARTST